MKNLIALSFIASVIMVTISCTKTGVKPTTASQKDTLVAYPPNISGAMGDAMPDSALIGNWMLVSDSIYYTSGGSQALNSGSKYTGQSGDYFNITNDGKIYMKEGTNYQTIDYALTNSLTNSVELLYMQYPNVAIVGSGYVHAQLEQPIITANSATLISQMITPGGIFSRKFYLKKL